MSKTLILDTETTGIPKFKIATKSNLDEYPHIVQLSYIIVDTITHEIIKIVDHIVRVPSHVIISEETSNIHGITNEISMQKGISIHECMLQFLKDYNTVDTLVAHNFGFDINMIKAELMRLIETKNNSATLMEFNNLLSCLNKSKKEHYCTLQNSINLCDLKAMSKKGVERSKFPKLEELHEYLFQTKPVNLHNSLNDVYVCLRCYYMIKYEKDILTINEELNGLYQTVLQR